MADPIFGQRDPNFGLQVTLAQQIRAAYPGAYEQVPDDQLEAKWRLTHGTKAPNEVVGGKEPQTEGAGFMEGIIRNMFANENRPSLGGVVGGVAGGLVGGPPGAIAGATVGGAM